MAALRAPLRGIIRVTDIFGVLRTRDDGSTYRHGGIDLALRGPSVNRAPILAPADGTVAAVWLESQGGYPGNAVALLDTEERLWRFLHMVQAPSVSLGAQVIAGSTLGLVGSTGNSTGDHLHLDVAPGGGISSGFEVTGAQRVDPLGVYAASRAAAVHVRGDVFAAMIAAASRWNPLSVSTSTPGLGRRRTLGLLGIDPRRFTAMAGGRAFDPFASIIFAARVLAGFLRARSGRYRSALSDWAVGPDAVGGELADGLAYADSILRAVRDPVGTPTQSAADFVTGRLLAVPAPPPVRLRPQPATQLPVRFDHEPAVWVGRLQGVTNFQSQERSAFTYRIAPLERTANGPATLRSLTLVDGIGAVDDTMRLDLATDDHDPITSATDGGDIVLIGLGGRLFGPYDVQPIGVSDLRNGQIASVGGRVGGWFAHSTAAPRLEIAAFLAYAQGLSGSPFAAWAVEQSPDNLNLSVRISGAVASATDLPALRSALETWGMTVSPGAGDLALTGDTLRFERIPRFEPIYPLGLGDRVLARAFARPAVGPIGRLLGVDNRVGIPRVQNVSGAGVLAGGNIQVVDAFNRPDSWRTRRIEVVARSLATGAIVTHASGTSFLRPPVYLPTGALGGAPPQVLFDLARWRLQNEAVTARLVLRGNAWITPQQILRIPAEELPTYGLAGDGLWRVTRVEHAVTPETGYLTTLDLALWQGAWTRVGIPVG